MMTINERISLCIKESGLRKTAFAKKINVTPSYVSRLASGTKMPSERTITDICREFGINEEWLKFGNGEMRIEMTVEDEIAAFVANVVSGDSEFWKNFIVLLARMTPEERDVFERKVREFAEMFGEK